MAQKEEEVDLKQKSNNNTKINEILSDEGKIALVKLCWLELCSLYGENHERPLVKKYICDFIKFLGFPKGVQKNITDSLISGLDKDIQADINSANNSSMLVSNLKKRCGYKDENLACIAQSLIIFTLGTGKYDARHRVVLSSVSNKLGMSQAAVEDIEHELVSHLKTCKDEEKSEEEKQREKQQSSRKLKRGLLIGLGALGGGALIGLTGGLAAPLLAAGVGTIFGSSIAVALGSVQGIAIVTSLFGAAGVGLTGLKLNRRMGSIEEFAFEKMDREDSLNVVIAVSGWLEDQEEQQIFKQCGFEAPWKEMKLGREQYYLRWESSYLQELGTAISSFLTSSALGYATDQVIKHTILQGIASAVAWPLAILKFGYVIDNPWGVCASRSVEVGKYLAYILMEKHHGKRPVTLVGFSFGARVIFHCLKAMAKMKDSDWIIQDVILIGAPVTGDPEEWKGLEKVIAGKIVNCYCRGDWLLKFVYRAASVQGKVAGLKPVMWKNRRMFNVNLDQIVKRHTDYCNSDKIQEILEAVAKGGVCPLDVDVSSSEDSGISLTSCDLLDLNETLKETAAAASVESEETGSSVPQEQDKIQEHSEKMLSSEQREDSSSLLNTVNLKNSNKSDGGLQDICNANTPVLGDTSELTLNQAKTNLVNSDKRTLVPQDTCDAEGPPLEDTSELNQAIINLITSDKSTLVTQDTCNVDTPSQEGPS